MPAFVGVSLGNAGYAVYRISKVNAGTPDLAKRASEAQQMANTQSQQELDAYVELLKKKAKVTINKAALEAPVQAVE